MQINDPQFVAYMDEFTPDTFIMIVMHDHSVESEVLRMNIRVAKKHFHKHLKVVL